MFNLRSNHTNDLVAMCAELSAQIAILESQLADTESQLAEMTHNRDEWVSYAITQEQERYRITRKFLALEKQYNRNEAMQYKIDRGMVKAQRVSDDIYALELPGMPVINDENYSVALSDPVYDSGGKLLDMGGTIVINRKTVESEPAKETVKTEAKSENGNKSTKAKAKAKDNGKAKAESGSFENAKYGDLVKAIKAQLKRDLTSDESEWLKIKFEAWEAKPASIDEYAKRAMGKFNAK